jgi:hypothetical protein
MKSRLATLKTPSKGGNLRARRITPGGRGAPRVGQELSISSISIPSGSRMKAIRLPPSLTR